MSARLTLATAEVLVGVVLILVSLPLQWNKIPRNRWYGFRIPRALRSEEAWYDINRYGARQMIIWCIPLCASGILKMVLPFEQWNINNAVKLALMFGPILVCIWVPLARTLVYAEQREKQQ